MGGVNPTSLDRPVVSPAGGAEPGRRRGRLALLLAVLTFGGALHAAPAANAASGFSLQPEITGIGGPGLALATADFNTDQDLDLAVGTLGPCCVNDGGVTALLGQPGGGFTVGDSNTVTQSPIAIGVGDFNGDADPDLAIATQGFDTITWVPIDTISVMLGQPGGGFGAETRFRALQFAGDITVGDFNGDADPDLAVLGPGRGVILLGKAGGTFGPPTRFESGGQGGGGAIAVGEFNGDGDPDLAVANSGIANNQSNVAILLGEAGSGFSAPSVFPIGAPDESVRPGDIAVADFNGDSDSDLVTANGRGSLSVLLGQPGVSFGADTTFAADKSAGDVAVSDFNGDSDPDLAIASSGGPTSLAVRLGRQGGDFGAPLRLPVGRAGSIVTGDFDGDVDDDLAVTNGNAVSILLNNGVWGVDVYPSAVSFPATAAGSRSPVRRVTLGNNGSTEVAVSDVATTGTDAAAFEIVDDTCSGQTIQVGDTCTVDLRFRPVRTGAHSASLELADDAPGSPHTVALMGTGNPAATLSTGNISWGPRPDSTKSPYREVTLTNRGGVDLTLANLVLEGTNPESFRVPDPYDACGGATLHRGASCTALVRFRPDGVGPMSATLVFPDDAPDGPRRLQLAGTGSPGPWLTTSLQGLKFGRHAVGTQSAEKSLTLTNTGSAPMEIGAIAIGGANPGEFVDLNETCTGLAELGPDESCTAGVAFRPSALGERTANLTIDDTAPRNPHRVQLQGTGG
jgi:hypothetical protein